MFLEAKDTRDLADVAVTSDWSSVQPMAVCSPSLGVSVAIITPSQEAYTVSCSTSLPTYHCST